MAIRDCSSSSRPRQRRPQGPPGVLPRIPDYLTDLIAAVKQAGAQGASLDEMKKTVGDQLAPKYEQGMSKYPLGRYRDRVGQNVEMVYLKVVKKG